MQPRGAAAAIHFRIIGDWCLSTKTRRCSASVVAFLAVFRLATWTTSISAWLTGLVLMLPVALGVALTLNPALRRATNVVGV
jgi:hypothetical protein